VNEHEDQGPGSRWLLFWLNVAALVVVALWAASLPFGGFYAALNDGVALPGEYAKDVTFFVMWLVGPLVILNALWLLFAWRRWREPRQTGTRPRLIRDDSHER